MDGDIVALAGMVLSLLLVVVIGGIVLLWPLSRRLGELLEQRLEERKAGGALDPAAIAELRSAVQSLEGQVARLAERQSFTERLLDRGAAGSRELPPVSPEREVL